MSSIRRAIEDLKKTEDKFTKARTELAMLAGFYFSDSVVTRISEKRVNEEGEIFGIYADSTWKYKKRRLSDDRRINFRDRNFMLNTTKPALESVTEREVAVSILPRHPGRDVILGYHQEKFDQPIIAGSAEEIEETQQFYISEWEKFLDQNPMT